MSKRNSEQVKAHWFWPVPKSWEWVRISEVADVIGGGTPSTTRYEFWEDGDIPWITPADLSGNKNREIASGTRKITQAGLDNSSARILPARSVLFSSRAPIGYVAIAANPLATNQGFKSFVVSDGIMPEFVYYYLQRAKQEITELASGTTFLEISASKTSSIPIPIPPNREQERIVEKLDSLFSRLSKSESAARRSLKRIQRYKAAVLHAAATGELTRDWRKTHHPKETGTQLLRRVLTARRARWEEAELKRLRAAGKPPKDDKWKKRYSQPIPPDLTKLSPLPRGWAWMSLYQITRDASIGLDRGRAAQSRHKRENYFPYVKMNNVTLDGHVLFNDLAYVPASKKEQERYELRDGDVLFNTRNSQELVGKTGIVRKPPPSLLFNNNLMRLRFEEDVNPAFVCFQMCSGSFRNLLEKVKKATTNIAAIYGKDLFPLPLAIASLAEQRQITAEVKRRLMAADRLAATLNRHLERAHVARQFLLREAFAGNLVPQKRNEEPASALLKRIRAFRELEANTPKAKRMPKAKSKIMRRPILDIMRDQKKPISPEQLYREAGFQPGEADAFYRELTSLRKQLSETKPAGAEARAWPLRAKVLLELKKH